MKILVAALLSAGLGTAATAATNIVVNGDFESTTSGADKGLRGNLTMATGWTLQNPNQAYGFIFSAPTASTSADTTGAFDPERPATRAQLWGPGNGTANGLVAVSPTGGNFLALDADPSYAPHITQELTGLTIGQAYVVDFSWAAAQFRVNGGVEWSGPTDEQLTVGFGSQSASTDRVFIVSNGFSPWRLESYRFVAESVTQTLSFLANGGPSGFPPVVLLDSVSVAAVPEPATWGLMLVGFAAVGIVRRRRSNVVAA